MKVVIDTNVIVSFFLTPTGLRAQVVEAWYRQVFQAVITEDILAEYKRALMYEKVAKRHGMNTQEVEDIIAGLSQVAILVEPVERLKVVKEDPEDDKFLECAVEARAEFIVSGDPHLLKLQEYRGIQILSPGEFLSLL